ALLDRFALDDRAEQLALIGKVHIKSALRHARHACDLAHAGAVEAEVHEDLVGAVHDLTPLGGILVLRGDDRIKGGAGRPVLGIRAMASAVADPGAIPNKLS